MPWGVAASAAISAGLGALSASNAAGAEKSSANQLLQYANQLNSTTTANEQPYLTTGSTAAGELNADLPSLTQVFNPTMAQLEQTPGYQFTLQQGLESTQNGFAAQGLGVSGAALKGAASYATGLANSTYQTDADIYNQNRTTSADILNAAAGLGQGAASQIAQTGAAALGTSANAITGIGNATAANDVAQGSNASNALGNLAQAYLLYNSGVLSPGNSGTAAGGAATPTLASVLSNPANAALLQAGTPGAGLY